MGNFLGSSTAPQRNLLSQPLDSSGLGAAGRDAGVDEGAPHRIDADAFTGDFVCDVVGGKALTTKLLESIQSLLESPSSSAPFASDAADSWTVCSLVKQVDFCRPGSGSRARSASGGGYSRTRCSRRFR